VRIGRVAIRLHHQEPDLATHDVSFEIPQKFVLVQCAALFCTYPAAAAKAALARVTLAKMSVALAVQMNGFGSML